MRWWPWRRRRREDEHSADGHAARKAKEAAEAALREAEARWPDVHHARSVFAREVDEAFRRRRRQA